MSLSLQRDDTLDILNLEIVAGALVFWSELLNYRALSKSNVIFVSRENLVLVLLRSLLNHSEERTLHLLTVDDESTTENLMTAVLRVNLCETENLRVSQRTTILLLQSMQIFNLLRAQSQTFLLVIFLQIIHILDGLWLDINREDFLIQSFIHALQHLIVLSILAGSGEILFYTQNAAESHVLSYLNGIC